MEKRAELTARNFFLQNLLTRGLIQCFLVEKRVSYSWLRKLINYLQNTLEGEWQKWPTVSACIL